MTYRWVEHTAEIQLEITAESEQAVFRDALRALQDVLAVEPSGDVNANSGQGEGMDPGDSVTKEVIADAPDQAALLAEWLTELVYLSEREDFFPQEIEELIIADGRVEARVRGSKVKPRHLVKGVTYHRLMLKSIEGIWQARVIFDV